MELFSTLALALVGLVLARELWTFFFGPLVHLPGPLYTRSGLLSLFKFLPEMLRGRRAQYTSNLIRKYGPLVRSFPTMVACADPVVLSAALATANGWPKDPKTYMGNPEDGSRNLFSLVDHDAHKTMRRKLSPAFSIKSLNATEPIIASVVTAFLERLNGMAKSGNSADFLKLFGLFTGEIIGEVAFGDRWGLVKTGHSDVLELSEKMVKARVFSMTFGRPFALALATVVPMIREGEKAAPALEEYAMNIVKNRRSGKSQSRDDLLQRMIESVDSETGERLTDKEIANNCLLLIVAGDETTAHQLSFTTYNLLTHPVVVTKLVAELDRAAEDSKLSPTDLLPHSVLKDLPYLDAVIHESFRVNPTTFGITRRVVPQDFVHPVTGIVIPAGVSIEGLNGPASRDPSVFDDPASFLPERWMGIKEADVKWNWLPFSRGPHNCIGSGLAVMEMKMLLGNLFRRFELRLMDRELAEMRRPLETKLFLTMAPKEGELEITVKKRA
ncbi:cytochrome P450 [Hyaloraphidium curvatum]|nr:cytochrome P450 [Hyaloraphidium curvatum]